MSFNPRRRYSAVAVFSDDLERVVLIHKLRPDWQAGKANLPGGKVEESDGPSQAQWDATPPTDRNYAALMHHNCARRELAEETGLDIAAAALQLFCRLRFVSREGDAAECCFFAARGDVDAARTMEAERVFVSDAADLFLDSVGYRYPVEYGTKFCGLETMPNIPYLVAMARQCLRGEGGATWPLTVYENGATP